LLCQHGATLTHARAQIDLKDVNLFVGERQLLNDAHLRIKAGVHYGFVGQCAVCCCAALLLTLLHQASMAQARVVSTEQ